MTIMRSLFVSILLVAATGCGDDPPNVGGTCAAMDDCDDGLTCDTGAAGGYCTKSCTMPGSTSECPDESVCDAVVGTAMSCVKICTASADCRTDQDCNGISGSNIKACKPKP